MNLPLNKLFEKAYQNRRLLYAFFELTFNCNFACKFCYNPVLRQGQERGKGKVFEEKPLSLEEYKELLTKLKKGGVLFVTLSGGEPLVHPDFWDIVASAKKEHFCIRIFSNGSLIDKDAAKRMKEMDVFCVEISLYGASKETYKAITGREDGFEKATNAIKYLKEEGVGVYTKCIVSKFTENEMDEIQKLADNLEVILRWDHLLNSSEDGLDYPLKFRASEKNIERLFSESKFKASSSPFMEDECGSICTVGRMSLNIDPYGNINPCVEWKEPLGNVRRDDIFEVWENSDKLKEIMKISEEVGKKVKSITDAHQYCFNCIGRSKIVYGDPYKVEPLEIKVAELRKRSFEKNSGNEK
jgi:radical SAM protein with 4Fe4S-binding SPASM domain